MKKTVITKLSILLVIFMAISLASCDYFIRRDLPEIWQDATYVQDTELGEGSKTFTFVVQVEENMVTFTIHTDAETVGKALLGKKVGDSVKVETQAGELEYKVLEIQRASVE